MPGIDILLTKASRRLGRLSATFVTPIILRLCLEGKEWEDPLEVPGTPTGRLVAPAQGSSIVIRRPTANSMNLLASLVNRSKRKALPLAVGFLRREEEDTTLPPPPLAKMFAVGEGETCGSSSFYR